MKRRFQSLRTDLPAWPTRRGEKKAWKGEWKDAKLAESLARRASTAETYPCFSANSPSSACAMEKAAVWGCTKDGRNAERPLKVAPRTRLSPR